MCGICVLSIKSLLYVLIDSATCIEMCLVYKYVDLMIFVLVPRNAIKLHLLQMYNSMCVEGGYVLVSTCIIKEVEAGLFSYINTS